MQKWTFEFQTWQVDEAKLCCYSNLSCRVVDGEGNLIKQERAAIADKLARRESLPKIAPIRRAYNVVADNTGLSSFV